MVQKLTSLIEIYVRKYPAEWSWIHRRWKAQMPSRAGIRQQFKEGRLV
jgi:lauroyl/myristoyl acyltransferase